MIFYKIILSGKKLNSLIQDMLSPPFICFFPGHCVYAKTFRVMQNDVPRIGQQQE